MQDMKLFFLYVFILTLGSFLSFFFINKVIDPLLEKVGKGISKKLIKKTKGNAQRILTISEILFTLITLIFVYTNFSLFFLLDFEKKNELIFSIFVIYSVFIVIVSKFIVDLKDSIGNYNSLLEKLVEKINRDNYFINRLGIIFGRTAMSLFTHILIVYALLVAVITFQHMPYQIYYMVFIILPISLITFVYLTDFDGQSQNMRRILVYLLLLMVALWKSFNDFKVLMELDIKSSVSDYLVFIILTIFIAIDRLIKSVIDDYKSYHECPKDNHANFKNRNI